MTRPPPSLLGATPLPGGGCRFVVYAPSVLSVEAHVLSPEERFFRLERDQRGYHQGIAEGVGAGATYLYRLDGGIERPDPASRHQPEGVHGPSRVVDPGAFRWRDGEWRGIPLPSYILYELHVGTFTPEGTFEAAIPHLDYLAELGITAVELMPVAQFPGRRNWGYDGVFPFAVQESYGGPDGLRTLVDACHRRGLAVVLDVVYNHLGPEGNCLRDFGPYFTGKYGTPWGPALNFDGPWSDEVRRYFLENALCWFLDYHIDALRLDAIHGIVDMSARPFLAELAAAVRRMRQEENRRIYLIPESDLNDARVVEPPEKGGYGLDAQWSDDFHHALHTLLTGERDGYYSDFGGIGHMARAFTDGYVYSGQYSEHRKRRHGNRSGHLPAWKFVVFSQNHDQVGNRMLGERLSRLVPFESLKVAAGAVLLSPFLPLIFMGEEYGEHAPFLYFVHHGDPDLIEAVRKGRREEFASFRWSGDAPDPQDEATFLRSRLDPALRGAGRHARLLALYRELIRLRKSHPALSVPEGAAGGSEAVTLLEAEKTLLLLRGKEGGRAAVAFNFGDARASLPTGLPLKRWRKALDSSDARWGGAGGPVPDALENDPPTLPPKSFVLFLEDGKEGP